MSANNTFPENSPYSQYSYKNLNYVNPYSNFEEDVDSYPSEFVKADMKAIDAIVNRNRALERKDYKEAEIYQKEYEYNSKLAQYYSAYEKLNKKPIAFNSFLERQNLSEDQKQGLITEYHKLIAQTFLKGLTQQYIEAEKKDALSNMPVPIGGTLLQTNIVGGVSLNIPKFKIETTGEDRENLIYRYLEKYFYEDINKQFEKNERLNNYYKPATEESIKKENERYNKEYADYVSGKRNTIPSKPKYQNDFFEDLLYSTVDKTTNIKSEDAYYNGLYNFYNEIYRNTIDVQSYGSEKAKQGYYDQSKPVTVVGVEPYISTNIEFVNHTVGREIYNMVEDFATRKSEQLIMSRSFDRLEYKEFKKSHAKELKTLALNSDKNKLEKRFNITLQSENGISQNTYNRVYNDFIRGKAKNKSGSYNDEERDAYKIIDAYLTKKDLLTSGEIANFKTNVQEGGIWYGALRLEETNLFDRLALKFSNRLNSDSKQDRRTTITFDDGTNVILKENVDPRFSSIYDKEELDQFTKIYEKNKSIQEQQDIKSYMNTVVTKELALQIEKSLDENPENAKTIDDYEKAKLNFIPKEAQEKVGTTGSSPNTPFGLLRLVQKGYANVKENKILEEIISINTDKEGFIGATIYGKKFTKEQVRVIQQYEALELIKSNNEKAQEYFKEIKNSSFWNNFGEGFLTKGMGSIETSLTSIYVRKDIQYYNNPELAFENGLAEKYRGSILAGNYNNNFEQLVVKKEENGEDVIVANNIPEQIMGQEELIYLQSVKNKNEALDSWSNNAGLLTRVGESVGISAWFMAEMALTWGVYGAIGKGLIGTANTISRGMMAGAKGISSASESMMIGAGVRLGAKGVSVGTKAIGYVDAGVGYGLKGIGSIVEGASYIPRYFGTALEIGKLSKIAQFPARLVQNTIANSVLSLVSPSTINFVMDDMNSKGKVHYVDVNGVTVPVGHPDVAAFLYDIEKQNYQEFKNTILDNDDKLLAYYGISGDVKNKKEILEKLRFDYNESFNKRQDELSFIKDKKGPQLYSSIAQGVYEQFLERFTETSIGTVLDLALKNTFGKLAGRAEMWLGKDTRVITDLSKKSAIISFARELTGIGAYEGGNFLQKTGFLGMKFINNYLFGRATVNGFVNSPLSEIGEEIFRQLLPTKVFNIPDGKTFLSSYAEDIAQLSSWKWWEEVSASVLLTTTMMKLGSSTIRSINDAGTNSELKDAKTIKEISNKRKELIEEFKDNKPELKRKLNEFDAKNPLFITTPKTSGVKRRLMEDITLDINYANEEALLGKWAAGNSFGVLMGQADIDYVSGWMAKSSKLNNVNISKEDAKAILMKKMVNNIAHVFSLRQENTVEALTLLKQRYETFFGKAKDGKNLMLDVINTQIDIEKKFNAKLTSLSKEIKTDDKIKLAFILRNISTQFHKTRHSMVELDLLKDTINSMFESNLPDEQKDLISTISELIGEINDNFFTNDFSLESNNEFKKDLAAKLITLSRSIESLKNKTNDENQKVILEAGYQLLQKNMSNFTSFFASKSKISEIENDYYKSQLLSMIKKSINADVIEKRLKGKLSKESQEFLNLYKTRSKNNSRQIESSDLSNGDIIVKQLKDNQVKILIVNKELLPDGTIKTTLFDSLGNIEPNQENLWTATEEETKIFVNEQQKLSKPSSVNTSTVYRPKHHFFKLTKDLMSSRKKALNYFYNWLQTEKDNLKNDTKSLEELYIYAEKIETALIEYFNLPNNRKKEVDLSDYGFDTTSNKAMIEIEPINIDSASNLDPEFILYLKKVYNIYNIKKIKDLKKLMKRKLGLFFDIKELESYKETVSEKSYNNYIENKINEFINEHLKNVYSFGFNLNEVRKQLKNEDTTEPIKIDEKGEYVFYDGKIHESKSFNKELYDFNNDIDPVSGMRKSQIVPRQNTNTKTTTEKTTEKNIETTTEKVEEKKEENTNNTQKDTSIKETSNESTAEESEQIKENTKEEIKNTSIIEEEKITSEYKIPELTKEEENLSDEERKNIVDENLKTIDFDELLDDDLYSFHSEEFSTLSELDEEFKNLKKAQINAIVKIAKAIKFQRLTTWDNVVQFMINKGYLQDNSPISMIEIIRYSAFLADIHVSKSTIKEWFETVQKTNFKQYFDNKFNLNTHSISEDDVEDLLKFEKDIDVLYFQLTETQTPVEDSSFTVLWRNKDNQFYDKNQQEVNDENKSIVPYDYENNITSNLFLRVPIRWNENGEQTDFLYVELPKQNLKNGLTNITKIFKKIKKATNLTEASKKSFLWAYMVVANPELRDNKKLQEHIKKFNFNDSNFQDINFKTHSLIYDINKGFQIVEKFSLNLFDIRIPFEIVNFKNENGEVLQTLSGIMDDDTMNNGGISINELKGLQAKKIKEKNEAEQLNRSELGLALVNVKKIIVKEVIHATLKKLKNRDISISTMLILIKDKIDEYVEKNYKNHDEKEKDLLKSQMLGLIPGTYDNSVSSEFAQLIGISKETTLNFIKKIEKAKIKLGNKEKKEQREFLLEKDPSELTIEEIEWLDNNLESDDLTKSEIETALFGMADNQLSSKQKLSTIIGLALYGIEYKDVDNITRYLSVGEAIQLFVSAYSLGTEGYNWSFDHTHRNVQEKMNNNDYSEDLKTTLNALFNRINDLSKDYEIGEAIIRELYTKMDVEGISFLALQRQLDEQSDFLKSRLIEIGTSNAMAKSDSAMFKGAVKSGLIELKLKEGFVIDGFAFNENKKNEANDYMRSIITINDPLYKKGYIKLFFNLIGLTQVPDSAIELLLKLNSDTKVNNYFKEGGIFYELINKDVVSRKSFNLIFTVNDNNQEQYDNISDIFKKTMLYEEQSFYDNGKLSYNLKNKSHTDDINNFLKYGDEQKRRKFLEEKHSFIGEVLLEDLTLADELYTQRLSSDLSRISGYEYFESFKDLTDDNKKIAMYNLFKQSSKFKKQINGFNIITFKALGITQSDYDVIDVNNTFGVDFTSDIVFQNGKILISDKALDFIALHFFKEDVYRMKKFQENKIKNRKDTSQIGMLFLNIPELNSYKTDDGNTLNYLAVETITESDINSLYQKYKNVINNTVKDSIINDIFGILEYDDKELTIKNYDKTKNGFIEEFSDNNDIAKKIGNFIINQKLSYNNSLSLYFDDINDVKVKADSLFAGGNINKRMLDKEEYEYYNNEEISTLASNMLNTKDLKQQEELWDNLNEKINKITGMPHKTLQIEGTLNYKYEQNIKRYIKDALKDITNRARKLRSPSVRIFKGFTETFYGKKTYSILQLESFERPSEVLYKYMELHNIGTIYERQILKDSINDQNLKTHAEEIINKYKNNKLVKVYGEMEEADGQEYESWRFRLSSLLAEGKITNAQFKELRKVFEKQMSELKSGKGIKTKLPDWLNDEYFAINKPVQVGNIDGRGLYVKSASACLIPDLIESSKELTQLAIKLDNFENTNQTIARVAFQSAIKQGQIREENSITVENILNPNFVFSNINAINDIDLYSYGLQVENPQIVDEESLNVLTSQGTKMFLSGVVAETRERVFEFLGKKYNGTELNEKYIQIMTELSNRKLEACLSDYGVLRNIETNRYEIIKGNKYYKQLKRTLEEALKYDNREIGLIYKYQDQNGDIIESTREYDEERYKLVSIEFDLEIWKQDQRGELQTILMADIRKYAAKHKIHGNKLKVMSSFGFENLERKKLSIKDVKEENKVLLTNDYTGRLGAHVENGVIVHHVLAPMDIIVSTKNGIEKMDLSIYLNEDGVLVLPEELKYKFSWRVPLSGIQSSSIIKVVGFLPKAVGNILVTSQESATQLGEDFDFDTRFTYNTVFNSEGKFIKNATLIQKRNLSDALDVIEDEEKQILDEIEKIINDNLLKRQNISREKYQEKVKIFKNRTEDLNDSISYQLNILYPELEKESFKNIKPQILNQPNTVLENSIRTYEKLKKLNFENNIHDNWIAKFLVRHNEGKAILNRVKTKEEAISEMLKYFNSLGEKIKVSDEYFVREISDSFIERQLNSYRAKIDIAFKEEWESFKRDKENKIKERREKQRASALNSYTTLLNSAHYSIGLKILFLEAILKTEVSYNKDNDTIKQKKRDKSSISIPIPLNEGFLAEMESTSSLSDNNILYDYFYTANNYTKPKLNFENYKNNIYKKTEKGIWYKFEGEKDLNRFHEMSALSTGEPGAWCTRDLDTAKSYLLPEGADSKIFIFYSNEENTPILQLHIINDEANEIGGLADSQDFRKNTEDYNIFREFVDNDKTFTTGKLENYIQYSKALIKLNSFDGDFDKLDYEDIEAIDNGKQYYKDTSNELTEAKKKIPLSFYAKKYNADISNVVYAKDVESFKGDTNELVIVGDYLDDGINSEVYNNEKRIAKYITGSVFFNNVKTINTKICDTIGGNAFFRSVETINTKICDAIGGGALFNKAKTISTKVCDTIGGGANFLSVETINAKVCDTIGRDAYFNTAKTITAQVCDTIGGDAGFGRVKTITDKVCDKIGGDAYFSLLETISTKVCDTIGGDAYFEDVKTITDKVCDTIGGSANFRSIETITDKVCDTIGDEALFDSVETINTKVCDTIIGRASFGRVKTITDKVCDTIGGYAFFGGVETISTKVCDTIGGGAYFIRVKTINTQVCDTIVGDVLLYPKTAHPDAFIKDEKGKIILDENGNPKINEDVRGQRIIPFYGNMPEVLNQKNEDVNKAAFVTSSKSDKKYLVFGKGSDITSAIHEKAHEFEETLTEDEIKIVEQWCGYKRGTTEYKEAFAKGAEKAIYEGDFYDDSTYLGKIYKKFTAFFKKYITEAINYFKDINELNKDILEIYQNMFLNYEDSVPQYTNNNDNQELLTLTEDKFVYDASYYTIDSSGLFGIGYDDLSNEEKIIALNNTIIDLFKSILLANNTEVQKAITNPINFEIMTETKEILEENKKEDRFTSVLNIDDQIAQMNDGSIGKLGVALASMYNTLQSMFGMADEKAPIKFKNPANGKYQNLNFGNISFDGSKGFSNRAIGSRLISELGSEKQNSFVDNRNVSQMLALGITEDTINQYLIMTLIYGIDKEIIDETTGKAVDYSSTFMQLPIIKEYNKRLKKEYNNKTFNPKTTYDEIEKELQEKYLSKTTIDSFDKNTREYFNNQEKFRLKNSKSLTAKKIIELSNREFDSLEQEEKDILYSAFMNFKILSYQVGNMKKLNTIFGFEKNLIKKTNSSLENSTNEIIQILEGKHKINKSIENLDNLFGKIKTRDEIAGLEYNEYMELQRKYEDIPDDDIDEKKYIRNKLIEAKKRYYNRINKYIFIGKIDNEYKYLEPKNAIMARILSSRGYVELFENEFLSKQEWMNTLTKELDNYLNKQLMSAEKHGKYQESLRKFIIGIFNDNIITQLIDEDYRLDNGVVLTKQTFDNFINGDLYYLILAYCKNNQFAENKFIRSLYLDIVKGKTNLTIAYNNLNANKPELKDSVLELFNNNNNNQINSETEQLIKFRGTQYSQKDIMTLISLYAFKTNNINLISLLPSKFKESIQYNQRLNSIDHHLENMDNSLINTEDVYVVRNILSVDDIRDGSYSFNNNKKTLLDAALTKLNINHEFKNGKVILKDIKKENIKNYPLLFILQNAYLVSSMDEDKIPGLKRFFTEERIKELHEKNVLSFTRTEIINYFGWSNNEIHTRSKNLEYSRFNIFDKEKKENITIICHINESKSMVHFYPVNSPVKTAEEEEREIVIPETKNNNFNSTNESNENEGTQHYEQIVKDKSLFNTETSTIYLTSSGLGTVMLADKFIQGEDVPSWFLDSNGLRSLFTTSKKTVPVMAGIMFEDAIKEVQKTNDYSIENITEILKEKFSPRTFLGFDKNGNQLMVKTKTKKDKRFGIDKYILSDEKTKKSINKICSDENIKDMAISIRAYLLSNSKYQSFESFQETLPEDSPLKEGLISIETKYGKLMLATIPDQIAINDNINELIDIKFLQKEFTTKEEAISHVFNTYLQHITYPYSIYKKTGRETSFRYGIFAKVDGTLYYFESDKVTINNTNEQTYFNNIQSYVKKALNLFNADNDIFPLKYKQEYANALTYSSENKGHLKLNYIQESYLKTLEEAHIDDNGFLYKLALLKSEIKEKEQDFFNDLSRQDFEIKNKEEYFDRYIKKRDTPFTNTLRQVFINTNVVITNSKTKYNPETNTIYINRKEQTKEAILEETIHAATFNYISQYGKATIDFNELKLTYKLEKNAPQEIVDLFSLYEKTFDMFIKNAKERLNPIEFENMILDLRWKQFGKNFIDNKVVYAAYDISSPYEFVASFWKKTDGAKFLQIKDTRNILQKIWEILLKIFHLSNNITLDNNEKAYKKIVVSIVENNINNNVWYSENKETVNLTASNQIKQDNSELKC